MPLESMKVSFDLGWLIVVVIAPVLIYLFKRVGEVNKDLSDYKLAAQVSFASVGHLQEVERRLTDTIEGLRADIKELTKALNVLATRNLPEQR